MARKLAHEFKNILTPMQLSLQLLRGRARGGARRERARGRATSLAGRARARSAQLARLADQFSQYARLPEPRLEPLDLAEVARAAAAPPDVRRCARRPARPAEPVPVRGDRLLLSRAAHNLVLNACEASPRGRDGRGRGAARARRDAVLEVLDRGPGLPAGLARPAVRALREHEAARQRARALAGARHRAAARRDA